MSAFHRLAACLLLAGCAPDGNRPATEAAVDRARAHVERCDAGRAVQGCDAARRDLVEAERLERMAIYRATIEAGP
jgi:hypothetical protein